MNDELLPRWLDWAREIQAISQTGSHFCTNEFDRQRWSRLTEIAAEIVSAESDQAFDPLMMAYRSQLGYATPKVDVRAAVFQDGKLLLVRERADGGWTMPGGWADVGDNPAQAAEREVWEEAGYRVRAQQLVGVYDANRTGPVEIFHAFKILFRCELLGGEAQSSLETSEVAFFGPDEIPAPLSGERTKIRHIQAAFAALADPLRPADFD